MISLLDEGLIKCNKLRLYTKLKNIENEEDQEEYMYLLEEVFEKFEEECKI